MKTCGIHIGRRRFEVVALEGSARKPRIVASVSGAIPEDPEDPWKAAQDALKEGLAKLRFKPEEVGLAVDSGLAAFRNVTLPFEDEAKIEQVLKFEVESQLPQWDIDDVIVDFHVLASTGVESHLLVTAVRKDDLWLPLHACERAGMEVHEAELEASAVVNAAAAAGAFHADTAEVLVHVGETSTSLVLVDGGQLRSMRALHIGAVPGAAPAGEDGDEPPPAELVAERALEEVAARVRREIVRAVTAAHTANPLRAVLLTGYELPGLDGDTIQDLPVERLDPIPAEAGDVDGDRGAFSAAYGAALSRMGGGFLDSSLRREELRFTGTFERLELPLAVVSLLVVLLLLMQFAVNTKKAGYYRLDMGLWLEATNNYMLGVAKDGRPGILRRPPEAVEDYATEAQEEVKNGESEKSVYQHLLTIKSKLAAEVSSLERKLGRDGAVTKPQSALDAATAVLGAIDSLDERVGRFSLRTLQADYRRGAGQRKESVELRLDMTFFAESGDVAASHYDALISDLRSRPWVLDVTEAATKSLDGGGGIYADNIHVSVDTSRIEREPQG